MIVIRPILVNTGLFSGSRLAEALRGGLNELVRGIENDWISHLAHYNTPKAITTAIVGWSGFSGSDNENLVRYVNPGTRAHTIVARGGGMLAFQVGYNPKTTPGVIPSRPGGPFGQLVFARRVEHPGSEPRKIDLAIVRKRQPMAIISFQRRINAVFGA